MYKLEMNKIGNIHIDVQPRIFDDNTFLHVGSNKNKVPNEEITIKEELVMEPLITYVINAIKIINKEYLTFQA
ncbi:hypothetical protein LLDT4_00870 [Lactococcus lactis subsp. lactis bv. diacetylactis str. TIFN4]|nr:hypothetical protein LLDT4_00870 [Lactococcus lactis subsp. lactis bv. diacetylactis str. TIFN4]MCT4431372.1 hypothetical protein [Lactococcus cremoris]